VPPKILDTVVTATGNGCKTAKQLLQKGQRLGFVKGRKKKGKVWGCS